RPRRELLRLVEAVQVTVHAYERLLDQILGALAITDRAVDEVQQPDVVPSDQLVESALLAGEERRHEAAVIQLPDRQRLRRRVHRPHPGLRDVRHGSPLRTLSGIGEPDPRRAFTAADHFGLTQHRGQFPYPPPPTISIADPAAEVPAIKGFGASEVVMA